MWTAVDRALAEEFDEWQAGYCRSCGTRHEWWDPKKGGHRDAMIADFERCIGCEVKEQLQAQMPHDAKGLRVVLRVNPALLDEGGDD